MPVPVLIAGLAPAAGGPRGRLSTVEARPESRGGAWWTGRPVAPVAAPVAVAHPTAARGETAPGRVDPSTDAAGLRRHQASRAHYSGAARLSSSRTINTR